jgi:hypothetical protein
LTPGAPRPVRFCGSTLILNSTSDLPTTLLTA